MENNKKISTGKTVAGMILAILLLASAQLISLAVGNFPVLLGLPAAVGNSIAGILYPVCAFGGIYLLCKFVLQLSLEECKISKASIEPFWCVAAVVMPILVSVILIITSGHWENSDMSGSEIRAVITGAVFFFGFGTGIVEEMIFRGVIMSLLEYRFNKAAAVIVPSVLFGLLHIIGNELDFISTVQLILAGSMVGILFSLVTYESGNIWNSALIHGVWNVVMVGGIIHIGDAASENAIYNYVLETKSFLLTGGDFGVEASVAAVAVYLAAAIIAGFRIRKKGAVH